jgi:PAS domain S-box-containing protein
MPNPSPTSGSGATAPRTSAPPPRAEPTVAAGADSPAIPEHLDVPSAALAALVQGSSEGMLLTDESGFVTYANVACGELLGTSPEKLVGRSWLDLCQPEHVSAARGAFAHCMEASDRSSSCDVDVRYGSGEARPLSLRLADHLQTPGIGAILIHLNEAPSGALDRDESFHTLFERALVGLCVTDKDGNLLAFNDALLRPGGYARQDLLRLGNIFRLYADEADKERVLRIVGERGFTWREEVAFLRRDGSSYDTRLTLTPVRFRGRRAWYVTVEDISEQRQSEGERRRLEMQLWQAQKMQAVGSMTAGIAHDFNNILSVILTSADLMSGDIGETGEEQPREMAALRSAAERGSTMIRKLLGFSRSAELDIAPTNMAAVVGGMRDRLERLLPEHVALEMSLAEESTAQCDPAALEQMLMNVVTNSRDAMPGGGEIRIALGPAVMTSDAPERPQWMTPGEFVRLSVSDNGVGMDDATRARVLEPFFTTKAPGAGTGLGLSMVYGLAKQHGGFIDVLSELGHGTTVHLYFPTSVT